MLIVNQLTKLLNHPLNRNRKLYTLLKIIWWKVNQLFFKIPAIINMTDNAKLICYPNNSFGSFVVYANFPEYEVMNFINKTVENGDIVVDVGANIGSESVLAASRGKKVKVYAFEPTKSLIPLLNENIFINDFYNRIEIIQKAVSNKNGKVRFVLENESEINHLDISSNNKPKNNRIDHLDIKKTVQIDSVTLDTFIKEKSLKKIKLLKIDVEGAELLVLQGAQKALAAGKINVVLFEINKNIADYGYKANDIFNLLRKNKYLIYEFNQDGKMLKIQKKFELTKTVNLVAINSKFPQKIQLIKL